MVTRSFSSLYFLLHLLISLFDLEKHQEINNRIDSASSAIRSFHSNGLNGGRQSSLIVSNPSNEAQTTSTSITPSETYKDSSLTSHSQVNYFLFYCFSICFSY